MPNWPCGYGNGMSNGKLSMTILSCICKQMISSVSSKAKKIGCGEDNHRVTAWRHHIDSCYRNNRE